MKFYIPQLGDIIELTRDWAFPILYEYRNRRFIEAYGYDLKTVKYSYPYEKDFYTISLEEKTQLKIDRIYIRKNAQEYDSVTFIVEKSNNKNLKGKRFFASLKHVNNIEFKKITTFNLSWKSSGYKELDLAEFNLGQFEIPSSFSGMLPLYVDPHSWATRYRSTKYKILGVNPFSNKTYGIEKTIDGVLVFADNGQVTEKPRFKIQCIVEKASMKDIFLKSEFEELEKRLLESINSHRVFKHKSIKFVEDVLVARYELEDLETNQKHYSINLSTLKAKAKKILKKEEENGQV